MCNAHASARKHSYLERTLGRMNNHVTLLVTENGGTLKILLSFAVGALLGDVFLHLLPEAFESEFQRRGNCALSRSV